MPCGVPQVYKKQMLEALELMHKMKATNECDPHGYIRVRPWRCAPDGAVRARSCSGARARGTNVKPRKMATSQR